MSGIHRWSSPWVQATDENVPFWPNIEIKGRLRQVFAQRIRRIIKSLDQDLKSRLAGVSVPIPFSLLTTAEGQATFNQFNDLPTENKETNTNTKRGEENDATSAESPNKCVLIYVRVSTDEQEKNGRSIDSQIEELRSIVESDPEIELYREPIRDEGETGTDFDRDGIQRIARLAQREDVTHLMVDTIDRIGRSVAETLMFVHELREKFDVNIMSRGREIDVRKPTDRLQVTMRATMADFGTRNRARSSKRSSTDNFLKNKQWKSWYHSVPLGYELENQDGDDPASQGWIQRIDELEPVINDIYIEFINTGNYKKLQG